MPFLEAHNMFIRPIISCCLLLLISCSGGGSDSTELVGIDPGSPGGGTGTPGTGAGTTCPDISGQIASSNFTMSWDAASDPGLTGYRMYYGTTTPLTKGNALDSISVGNVTSAQLTTVMHSITACETVEVGISSLGDKPESSLSNIVSFQME